MISRRIYIFTFVLVLIGLSTANSAPAEKKKVPPTKTPSAPSLEETQQQLEQIIKIHKSLQTQHQREIQEIQKIMEQARAHQKLLRELSEKSPTSPVSSATPGMDIEEAIRSEKIELIQDQTQKNKTAIERLEEEIKKENEKKSANPPVKKSDSKVKKSL